MADRYQWVRALRGSDLASYPKLVGFALATYTGHGGAAFPSIRRLALDCSASRGTVQRALRTLEAEGWVHTIRRFDKTGRKTSSSYRLLIPAGDNPGDDPGDNPGDNPGVGLGERPSMPRREAYGMPRREATRRDERKKGTDPHLTLLINNIAATTDSDNHQQGNTR